MLLTITGTATGDVVRVEANHVAEIAFHSTAHYAIPEADVRVDVEFISPQGERALVPAFWDGRDVWKVRNASGEVGKHSYVVRCGNAADAGLNGKSGEIEVVAYPGANPFYKHGPVRIAADRRHFAHADGTTFFWLGDTQWMSLCKRIHWPEEFQMLADDRLRKGYNVIQIVAGLYPDMPPFDPRGANEAGFPWTEDYGHIRPEYFDAADKRIAWLCDHGIAPCVVGAWGYFSPLMGVEKLERHWRYLIARWGAYPVFWCVAGECNLPYYLAPGFPYDDRKQVADWTAVTRCVRETDPFHRPVSIHPTGLGKLSARGATDDASLLDFDMLQTGHGDRESLAPTVDAAVTAQNEKPPMPWLNSEVCYEGILGRCHDDVQRLMFWASMLNGAAGHTYGANGIWQLNQPGIPFGNSPHGGTYGPFPWTEAMDLPGSRQLGVGKEILERLDWTSIVPTHNVATWPVDSPTSVKTAPFSARLSNNRILIYLPERLPVTLTGLRAKSRVSLTWIDPRHGAETTVPGLSVAADGKWTSPEPPDTGEDWLALIQER